MGVVNSPTPLLERGCSGKPPVLEIDLVGEPTNLKQKKLRGIGMDGEAFFHGVRQGGYLGGFGPVSVCQMR